MTLQITIRTKKTRRQVLATVNRIPGVLTGRASAGASDERRRTLTGVGLMLLGKIHIAFEAKAGGRADESGLSWPALQKVTVKTKKNRQRRGGTRSENILRDLDKLERSLRPGTLVTLPPPASSPRVYLQVFRVGRNSVTVGTRREGALRHHEGKGKLPKRRLWPETSSWPASWWAAIQKQVAQGAARALQKLLG